MFIQVIKGRTSDPEGLRRQMDRWEQEIKPGAIGYLGHTGGVAEDGTAIAIIRFASEDEARRSSDRAEQGAWWSETEKYFDDVAFSDCGRVIEWMAGGSDDAGFVQVIQGRIADRGAVEGAIELFTSEGWTTNDALIGGTLALHDDGDGFTQTVYFTTEADARRNEAAMGDNPPEQLRRFREATTDITFIDLTEPWLDSA